MGVVEDIDGQFICTSCGAEVPADEVCVGGLNENVHFTVAPDDKTRPCGPVDQQPPKALVGSCTCHMFPRKECPVHRDWTPEQAGETSPKDVLAIVPLWLETVDQVLDVGDQTALHEALTESRSTIAALTRELEHQQDLVKAAVADGWTQIQRAEAAEVTLRVLHRALRRRPKPREQWITDLLTDIRWPSDAAQRGEKP